jgi:hypothetical protein
MKRTLIALSLCALVLTGGLAALAQTQKPKARDLYLDYQQTAHKPQQPRKGKPGSKVKIELLQASGPTFVSTKHIFKDDDRLAFRFAVNYDGYLTVTNIGTSGKVNVLFAGRVSATKDMRVPATGWIRVQGKSGDEVVNFIMSAGPQPELQQAGIVLTASGTPDASSGNLASSTEAQEILALLNSRSLKRGRDLVVEDDGAETYVLAASSQDLSEAKGFSISLKHR